MHDVSAGEGYLRVNNGIFIEIFSRQCFFLMFLFNLEFFGLSSCAFLKRFHIFIIVTQNEVFHSLKAYIN